MTQERVALDQVHAYLGGAARRLLNGSDPVRDGPATD